MTTSTSIDQRLTAIRPADRQLHWQSLEFYAFIHFGMNTMTDREWGLGHEDPQLFDPDELDADQWMTALSSAGMKGLILTAKHHDGFCLWPSKVTSHSVAASPWRHGQGDVVAEVSAAAARHGLAFGIYLSPWDRTETSYGSGTPYDDFFVAQLEELLTGYGPVFSVWFDGACGEGPNGKRQVYDWDRYHATIRRLQPGAVISVCGPDVRWCGNEAGHTRPNEWSVVPRVLQDAEGIAQHSQQADDPEFSRRVRSQDDDLGSRAALAGHEDDLVWYPAEVNTSNRPGWFYHQKEDDKLRSIDDLLDVYLGSVGGNSTFLLNVPPDRRGLVADPDLAALRELGRRINDLRSRVLDATISFSSGEVAVAGDAFLASAKRWGAEEPGDPNLGLANGTGWWQPSDSDPEPQLTLTLDSPQQIEAVILKEEITLGQRLEHVIIRGRRHGRDEILAETRCVGYQRILTFPSTTVDQVTVEIRASRGTPAIAAVGLVAKT
ncbi:alpha-L-fucosidase [Kribbella sindirgiensis]|nr:alpha-L-fucosidase [Kribbella sindirgiensis]